MSEHPRLQLRYDPEETHPDGLAEVWIEDEQVGMIRFIPRSKTDGFTALYYLHSFQDAPRILRWPIAPNEDLSRLLNAIEDRVKDSRIVPMTNDAPRDPSSAPIPERAEPESPDER